MAKKGKLLEQLVGAIQETIKDCPEIIVRTNAKITNDIGIQREIDVLVQNDTIMESFECKDYAQSKNRRAVDVQVVDGVIGKNKYLSQINKLNIVSTTGYTLNAKKEAESENINLLTLKTIPSYDIDISPTKIWQVHPKYKIEYPISISFYNGEQENCMKLNVLPLIYDYETKREVDIIKIIEKHIYNSLYDIMNGSINENNFSNYNTNRKILLNPNRKCYILDEPGKCYFLLQICLNVSIEICLKGLSIAEQSKLINENDSKHISTNSIYNSDRNDISIVNIESGEKQKFYYKTSDGVVYEPPKKLLKTRGK